MYSIHMRKLFQINSSAFIRFYTKVSQKRHKNCVRHSDIKLGHKPAQTSATKLSNLEGKRETARKQFTL